MKKVMQLVLALVVSSAAGLSNAATIFFNDFSSVSGLTLNGNAAQVGNVLRVTPATGGQSGSAFSTVAVPLTNQNSFSTSFRFRISNPGGIGDSDGAGADGLTFVVQTNANNVGASGGGIGYQGIANSVGIEFDTFDNGLGSNDPNGNHVGIDLSGNFGPNPAVPVLPRLNDGAIFTAFVDYNGLTDLLEVRLSTDGSRPAVALTSQVVDLQTVLGSANAFVGFTSGTGSGFGDHDILSWEFRDQFAPVGVPPPNATPEPASLALLAIAAAAFGLGRRRKTT